MAQMNLRPTTEPPLLRIEPFKGINLAVTPTQIDQSQSADLLNVHTDERGALNKRTGYERVFASSLGEGQINGVFEYRKTNGTTYFLMAHGTKLYTQSGNEQPVEIYNGLANSPVDFFVMNDKCYIRDGTHYLVFDGSSVSAVVPYIPTLSISKEPDGGGTHYEDFNLLGAGFKDSFSTLGTATVFQLSLKELDATSLKAEVNGTIMNEGAGFAVDRANGKITFTTAPAKGTNNVIITAYKTQAGFPERIKKCRFHTMFGGSNDTRVFLSGNPDMPDYVFRLGLYDPTYAPENGFYKYPDRVKGFSKQYDYLVVHRENGLHHISFELNNGEASFPSKPINDQVGTFARKSIQIVENNPVFLSRNGVYMLTASNVRDERNVTHISTNIDQKLLRESNFDKAISIDFDKKYWIALNGKVYLLDYSQKDESNPFGLWFIFDNIHASCFLEKDGYLYFGSSKDGLVYRFKKAHELYPYNDDGMPIKAYWVSKLLSFGTDERRKIVEKAFFSLRPAIRTSAELYYVSDKKTRKYIKTTRKDLFHYGYLDYSAFIYATNEFPQEASNKIKAKKIVYFQLEIRNEKLDEGFGILSVGIKFQYQSLVK